jgi:hypothetical protein
MKAHVVKTCQLSSNKMNRNLIEEKEAFTSNESSRLFFHIHYRKFSAMGLFSIFLLSLLVSIIRSSAAFSSSFGGLVSSRADFMKQTALATGATLLLPVAPANARGRATLDFA